MKYFELRKMAKELNLSKENGIRVLDHINTLINKGVDINHNSKAIELVYLMNTGIQKDIQNKEYKIEEVPFQNVQNLSEAKRNVLFYNTVIDSKLDKLKLPWHLKIFIYYLSIGELLLISLILFVLLCVKSKI